MCTCTLNVICTLNVHMQAECARLEMECAIEHTRTSRRCWWKWSRGVNGRWCQQLCSAALLCCVLCSAVRSALHWCQQLAAQAKAEHTSLPHVLPDQYCVLVYQQQHTFIYTMQYARIYMYSHIRIDTDIDQE